ncbi:MucR family transcriptional regulator [Sphingomonas sp. FW199]|uniref:MucR family transcriptional regulator n=1 Tax=Sphingomonas sp. FW199 TaxID=3400217 RepID=UPI003CF8750F
MTEDRSATFVELATELTIAWLGNPNNRVTAEEVPAFLKKMHETVSELSGIVPAKPADQPIGEEHLPAVSVRKSLASNDHILSMIDGKPYKTLRRHLSGHGLTPDEYRARYNLKPDYPMVAPAYSETRRAMAKQIGLGTNRSGDRAGRSAAQTPDKPKRPARSKKAEKA